MHFSRFVSVPAALLAAAIAVGLSSAHTWLDCLDHDHSVVFEHSAAWVFGGVKGNGLCEGYIRGYAGRGDVDINTKNTYKIARNDLSKPGIPLCEFTFDEGYGGARDANNATLTAKMSAKPGDTIYFAYLPNGHVAKDKWARKTEYGIYSSGIPGVELNFTTEFNETMLVDGTKHTYDDLNCGETYDRQGNPSNRAGDHIPCAGQMTIPEDTAPGRHQFVWAWKFYKGETDYNAPPNFIDYMYTSCFDVEVEPANTDGN
uniref:DUF7492 domain-containing protein n=1 Tax=Globisporangium ultimum (strain ATCC 200006 / CBS 805.95 / DAOM BR144) TaxID=431595 RepID=K3X193_GLOUD